MKKQTIETYTIRNGEVFDSPEKATIRLDQLATFSLHDGMKYIIPQLNIRINKGELDHSNLEKLLGAVAKELVARQWNKVVLAANYIEDIKVEL